MKQIKFFLWIVLCSTPPFLTSANSIAADKVKTSRFAFLIAETSFDPAKVSDLYSNIINETIFDAPLTYDFLASGEAGPEHRCRNAGRNR